MQKQLSLKTQPSQLQPPHCLKCGSYHSQNKCTAFAQCFYYSPPLSPSPPNPQHPSQPTVFLIGQWSDWKKKELMVRMEDYYTCQISLTPGNYQYKFMVDNEWVYDKNEPVVRNEFGGYNNVKEVIPKRVYLDEYEISPEDDVSSTLLVTIESTLPYENLHLVGSWDNWLIERPLLQHYNVLKNTTVSSTKIRLSKNHRYEFKFKTPCNSYYTDPFYPATPNTQNSMNNYLITSSYHEFRTPLKIRNSLKKTNSIQQTQWMWEKQDFEDLNIYNLYGHSLTSVGDVAYIFGGIYKNEFRDYLIKISLYDLNEYEQEKINISKRAYHTSVSDGTKVIIFGGLSLGAKILDDCRVYDTATKEWSQSLVMNGVPPPTNREKSTGVLYKDSIIVYGGYYCCCDDETEVIYNDIYIFNTKSMLWSKPKISEENSPPRFAHTSTIHEDQMLVFGGISSTTPTKTDTNSLWSLKIQTNSLTWSQPLTFGTPPSPRHGHTANILLHYLIVFGGGNSGQIFNDVVMLDLDTMEWINPIVTGEVPRPVVYHAAIAVGSQLVVIGGKTKGEKGRSGVMILKPKMMRRRSFAISSPRFLEEYEEEERMRETKSY